MILALQRSVKPQMKKNAEFAKKFKKIKIHGANPLTQARLLRFKKEVLNPCIAINQRDPFLYDMDRVKEVIGEQMRKIKKIPLASQNQGDCATMEVINKKSIAVHHRHEPKNNDAATLSGFGHDFRGPEGTSEG